MIRFIDRLLCLLLGHTWERRLGKDAIRCPLCETEFTALDQIAWQRRHRLFYVSDRLALRLPWPKRVW